MQSSVTLNKVQPPIIPMISEWVRNTPEALSLGQGMVSFAPPMAAIKVLQQFGMQANEHYYGASLGDPSLIKQLACKLQNENGIDCSRGYKLMVTAGANMAFLNVLLSIIDPGDEVILPLPYYFNQEMAIRMLNAVPITVPTGHGYQLDLARIRAAVTPKTRAIVTVSPNNPTGAVYSEADLREVSRLCREQGLYHISDEAYEYFVYDHAQHFSPGSIDGAEAYTITLYSLSKAYGFASWRMGYAVVPEALLPTLLKVQDTNLICPPLITQKAAQAVISMGSSYCKAHLPHLRQVRDLVNCALAQVPKIYPIVPSQGAFYQFIKLKSESNDLDLVRALIRDFKVAVIPGSAFGMTDETYLRISYGMLDLENTKMAMDRLLKGIAALA